MSVRRSASAACAAACLAAATAQGALASPPADAASAAYAVAVDGRLVESRAAHADRQPASLAKLAAALVVLKRYPPDSPEYRDAVVTVPPRAAMATGSRIGLRAGDRVPLAELLSAMLVASANDACAALVEHASGGQASAFVRDMNRLVDELGLKRTRFVDPCGHDREGQRTTASDMLLLAGAALAEPEILRRADQPFATVSPLGGTRMLSKRNTNALLGRYNGVFGLKTGYTPKAGGCLIAAAQLGSATVVVVILGSRDRWQQAAELLDRTFDSVLPLPRARTPDARGRPD